MKGGDRWEGFHGVVKVRGKSRNVTRCPVSIRAKYVHTNIVAKDWKRLATFYETVFGCTPVPPERSLREPWLERGTGVAGAEIEGMHLRLPGWGDEGPTLEIFRYRPEGVCDGKAINRPGLAHLAFSVEDVEAARDAVLAAGGKSVGDLVSVEVAGVGELTFVYMTDPEGNVIELQRWSRP